jgi:hypothetical protein
MRRAFLSYISLMPQAKFRRYEYRRCLPHYQKDERPLFVTFEPTPTQYSLPRLEPWP